MIELFNLTNFQERQLISYGVFGVFGVLTLVFIVVFVMKMIALRSEAKSEALPSLEELGYASEGSDSLRHDDDVQPIIYDNDMLPDVDTKMAFYIDQDENVNDENYLS